MTDDLALRLKSIRVIGPSAPVIVQPYPMELWRTLKRIQSCEIYALPEGGPSCLFSPIWWIPLTGRDVTLWPVDAWSSHIMTLIAQAVMAPEPPNGPFGILRWAWGEPAAEELGLPPAVVETLWKRHPISAQQAA